ncbi:MAG: rhomboid family intramembrane serine protease [Ponticaulis sp.]|nr:rhomboid family intramembrane serine protease [Ponticaulis sp.]|tara:strand:- start:18973 stop:19584 length:612 start_codon:yes stop_codon:yes gene_type:complete
MEDLLASRATLIFLVANVAISFFAFSNEAFLRWGILHSGSIIRNREYHRILTSGFLHADPMHLLFNMITLYFFGPVIESVIGSQSFFIVYLAALIGGSLFALFRHRNDYNYSALGASGAVSGIVFSFCLFAPFALIFVFFIPVPAILYAVLFMLYSLYGMGRNNDNIGHDAHLAGAVIGVVATILVEPRSLAIFIGQITSFLS